MRHTAPPRGFVDFVVARGPALHCTALLLTRQELAAQDLVQIALAKAWQSWDRIDVNHEAYVRRIIVNEFASSAFKALAALRVSDELCEDETPELTESAREGMLR